MVLRGNDIKDQSFEVALFQEMATTPITLEASRFCDLLGLLEGNTTQGRDVEQAYLLANMKDLAAYIVLPQEVWTKAIDASSIVPDRKSLVWTPISWRLLAPILHTDIS